MKDDMDPNNALWGYLAGAIVLALVLMFVFTRAPRAEIVYCRSPCTQGQRLCAVIVTGGYMSVPVANPCSDPRCYRVPGVQNGDFLVMQDLPLHNWIPFKGGLPMTACLAG
jgi:hypothetical protein